MPSRWKYRNTRTCAPGEFRGLGVPTLRTVCCTGTATHRISANGASSASSAMIGITLPPPRHANSHVSPVLHRPEQIHNLVHPFRSGGDLQWGSFIQRPLGRLQPKFGTIANCFFGARLEQLERK